METLHFSIVINAPVEVVWDKMLNAESYKEWTAAFYPGSYYEGSWDVGAKIRFIAPDKSGVLSGIVGRIKKNRPYEFVEVEYLGLVENDVEVTSGESVEPWIGALESYTFSKVAEGTELKISLDITESDKDTMQEAWPQALQKLKEICEG